MHWLPTMCSAGSYSQLSAACWRCSKQHSAACARLATLNVAASKVELRDAHTCLPAVLGLPCIITWRREHAHSCMRSWSSSAQPCTSPTMMMRPRVASSSGSVACTGEGKGSPAEITVWSATAVCAVSFEAGRKPDAEDCAQQSGCAGCHSLHTAWNSRSERSSEVLQFIVA